MREFHTSFAATLDAPVEGVMAIYRNTVLAGAVEALAANFPVVRALVGAEMFAAVAVDYASECPPSDPILAHYGAAFAGWIDGQDWASQLPYLSDVARVERLHGEALFAADADPLYPGALERLAPQAWTSARLTLHPATRLACSPWPAASLWLAHQDGGDLASVVWEPECILVTRAAHAVRVETIPAPAHHFHLALACGDTVAGAVETTLAAHPDAEITAAFTLLLDRGAFAALIA